MSLHGVLLVDKPAGATSFRVMRDVQRRLGCERAGHAGTLDPAATGLLVVLLGEGTKLSDWVMAEDKVYEAKVVCGVATDTLDADGAQTAHAPVPPGLLTRDRIGEILEPMLGEVWQIPPAYSAIKRQGRTLMSRARAGEAVVPDPRVVTCHSLEVLHISNHVVTLRVHCGKGYYVRALARDVGAALGIPAHLGGLRRVRVGDWSVEDAVVPEAVNAARVVPLARAIPGLPAVILGPDESAAVLHGRQVPATVTAPRAILTDEAGTALAMAVQEPPGTWRIQRGFRVRGASAVDAPGA